MIKRLIKILFIFCCIFVLANTTRAYYSLGQPSGFINDFTNTLTSEQKLQLENKAIQFEKDTSNEIAVAMINNLQDDTIENFAVDLFADWGIGKEKRDNGVLILIAKNDREMRIEVGYGLEGALTDAQASQIINYIMKPAFRNNDFYKGIDEAIDKIILATKGEYIPDQVSSEQTNFDPFYYFINLIIQYGFVIIIFLAIFLGRSKAWWLGGVLGILAGVVFGIIEKSFNFGLIATAFLLPLGLLFDFLVSKRYQASKSRGRSFWNTGGGRWGGGHSGGFGGFGGGHSGGGGSSGRW